MQDAAKLSPLRPAGSTNNRSLVRSRALCGPRASNRQVPSFCFSESSCLQASLLTSGRPDPEPSPLRSQDLQPSSSSFCFLESSCLQASLLTFGRPDHGPRQGGSSHVTVASPRHPSSSSRDSTCDRCLPVTISIIIRHFQNFENFKILKHSKS